MSDNEMYSVVVPLSWACETSGYVCLYYSKLVDFFKPYVEAASCTGIIECIRNSLKYLGPSIDCDRKAYIYLNFVFSLFEIFRCTNRVVIRNSLEEFIVQLLIDYDVLDLTFEPTSLLSPFPVRRIHYELISGYEQELNTDSFFYESFLFRDVEDMRTLLRYGVRFELEEKALSSYVKYMSSYLLMESVYEGKEEAEKKLQATIESNYPTYSDQRRLYFVLLAIEMALLKNGRSRELSRFVESMKMVFKTITDPLITVAEISRFCDLTMDDQMDEINREKFCSFFVEDFPKAAAPIQPRKLKNLCRCHVRECLMQAKTFPHGVWSLEIPNILHDYILLQQTDDEFNPQFVHDLTTRKTFLFSSGYIERGALL